MSAKFASAQWPWGTQSREEFIQSCKDMSEVGFEYFESGLVIAGQRCFCDIGRQKACIAGTC